MRARTLRLFMNLWPPLAGAGIHVTALASVDILGSDGEVVARATHTAYVRKKAPL